MHPPPPPHSPLPPKHKHTKLMPYMNVATLIFDSPLKFPVGYFTLKLRGFRHFLKPLRYFVFLFKYTVYLKAQCALCERTFLFVFVF